MHWGRRRFFVFLRNSMWDSHQSLKTIHVAYSRPSICIRPLPHLHTRNSWKVQFCSVQFSHSVVSDSLRPHGLQHASSPCSSPTPGVCPNSCPLSRWCHHNHLILCRPLLLPSSISPSIRVFSNESTRRTRWPKYWSLSLSISPSKEHPGLISLPL